MQMRIRLQDKITTPRVQGKARIYTLQQGCTNPGRQVAVAINCYMMARKICAASACNLVPVTLLSQFEVAPRTCKAF
jgi:hypothetical protein